MKPSQFTTLILDKYPSWDQDTKDFYIDLLIKMPYSELIKSFELGINLDSPFKDETNSNITLINFDMASSGKSLDVYSSVTTYLQEEYFGEDIIDFYIMNDLLIIKFQF